MSSLSFLGLLFAVCISSVHCFLVCYCYWYLKDGAYKSPHMGSELYMYMMLYSSVFFLGIVHRKAKSVVAHLSSINTRERKPMREKNKIAIGSYSKLKKVQGHTKHT